MGHRNPQRAGAITKELLGIIEFDGSCVNHLYLALSMVLVMHCNTLKAITRDVADTGALMHRLSETAKIDGGSGSG